MSGKLKRRAELHAALADPARLSIVDSLLAGDASPSELQAQLAMPSNLMAHHLGVLERAGLIHRSRSEGDRRRTYLRLRPGVLDGLMPASVRGAARVVFVCTHNSARSQLAAALWRRHSRVPVTSAGTHPAARVHPGTIAAARRHHLPLRPRIPRQLDDVLHPDDLVIAVCDNAYEELGDGLRRVHWSIADPAPTGTAAAFDRAVADLADRVTRLAPTIHRTSKGSS